MIDRESKIPIEDLIPRLTEHALDWILLEAEPCDGLGQTAAHRMVSILSKLWEIGSVSEDDLIEAIESLGGEVER